MQKNPLKWLSTLLVLGVLLSKTIYCDSGRNPQYGEWLKSYEGEFDQLKYTYVAYKGNRKANAGREKLAPADLGGRAHGITGNYFFAAGLDEVRGLNQPVALQAPVVGNVVSNNARFHSRGAHIDLSKRFFKVFRMDFALDFRYRKSDSSLSLSNTGNPINLVTGEQVTTLGGTQKNDFLNLDFVLEKSWSERTRYTAKFQTGIRLSDTAVRVQTNGVNNFPNPANNNLLTTAYDYHFRNLGVGPFIGVVSDTPITDKVRFAIKARQVYLPSKGKERITRLNRNAIAQDILNVTNVNNRFTSFPVTELAADINFFMDHSTRINLGYSYSHYNFYSLSGFGNEGFQDITFHGPRGSFNFLF